MQTAILAIDQGTTSSRAIIFGESGDILFTAQEEFAQIYPHDGWVEHDPEAIWDTVLNTTKSALLHAQKNKLDIRAIGITNQRETTIIWDRISGKPIYNAIVWQDRRTADICNALKDRHSEEAIEETINAKTGLLLDPYFSATKISWILDNVDEARRRADAGELAFGTVDSFLIWRLTGGAKNPDAVHATDATNASRTNLFNIMDNEWDASLCEIFNVPQNLLPEVKDCADDYGVIDESIFGPEDAEGLNKNNLGKPIPICGVAGDQQAALIGQSCFEPGDMKSTYGTGCFIVLNTGKTRLTSKNRLLSTIGYRLDGQISYAIEGSIFMAGASVQWLRDGLGIIEDAKDTEAMIKEMEGNKGVYLVPAFTGLGAPHWRPDARAALFGMTRDTGRTEIVRATLESVAYQTQDLLTAMAADGAALSVLKVDGGMIKNDWLCSFLAGITNLPVQRPKIMETTALGAAYLAGLQAGIYDSLEDLRARWIMSAQFSPDMDEGQREDLLAGWHDAVQRILS